MTEKIGGEEVEVTFNEYDHNTKKSKQVERQLTPALKIQIEMMMDDTDSGVFTTFRVGDITTTGYFEIVNTGI